MDDSLRDMGGRVVLVTGATSGIGRVAARDLGALGATVVVHGRDRERGRATLREVREGGGDGAFVRADLAEPDAVAGLAGVIRERYDRLDVLVNNAALSLDERRILEYPGGDVEAVFAVNHLAPYRLTRDLADLLAATGTPDDPARVVVTASAVHRRGDLALDDPTLSAGYEALDAYARSKLANVLFTVELAERLPEAVTANAFHPGFVPGTGLYRDTSFPFGLAVRVAARLPFVGTSVADGADGLTHLAASPDVAGETGGYFDGRERKSPDDRAGDAALRERLWRVSATLLGLDSDWP